MKSQLFLGGRSGMEESMLLLRVAARESVPGRQSLALRSSISSSSMAVYLLLLVRMKARELDLGIVMAEFPGSMIY